jgi:hypothetical protein
MSERNPLGRRRMYAALSAGPSHASGGCAAGGGSLGRSVIDIFR